MSNIHKSEQNYHEDQKIVLSYEKATELVFSQLHFSYGEMKKFCEKYGLQYNIISAIKNTYDDPKRETFYSPESIIKLLQVLNIETEIQKPKLQALFVIKNSEQKKEILKNIKHEEIAYFETINLVNFAKSNNYTINKQETFSFNKDDITVMNSIYRDETIIIKKVIGGKYCFINPHVPHDKGNIVDFITSRMLLSEEKAIELLRKLYREQEEGIILDKIYDKKTIRQIFGENLEGFLKEQKEILKGYFGITEKLYDRTILHKRGISNDIIDHFCFKESVFNKSIIGEDGKKLFTDTIFPKYMLQSDKSLLIIGTEQITKEYRSSIHTKRIEEAYHEAGIWLSRPYLGTLKKIKQPLTFYIGENALDCMAFCQMHLPELKDNYMFISMGNYERMHEKTQMLQNLVDELCPNRIVLINRNTSEGKIADIMLYSNIYEPSPISEVDGFRVAMRSEEQTYSPKVFVDIKGQGIIEVKITIPYKSLEERSMQRKFIKDAIHTFFTLEEILLMNTLEICQTHEIISFIINKSSESLDKLFNLIQIVQPKKKEFLLIKKARGIDYISDLQDKTNLIAYKRKIQLLASSDIDNMY